MQMVVKEVPNEGLTSLMGKRVTFICANYIWTGDLVGVNATCVKLDNPQLVYETGKWDDKSWKDAQALPNSIYVQIAAIEAFGIVK